MSRDYGQGVGFSDVAVQMRYLARRYNFSVSFDVRVPWRASGRVCLMVRAIALRESIQGSPRAEVGASVEWPNVDAKTFAGALFNCLHQLELKLEERESALARAEYEATRLPGF